MYFFGSTVHIKAVFTLYYNLLNVKLHGGRWKQGSGQGDTCTPVADSCQCVAKITTILESNEPQTRINKLILKKFQFRSVQSLSHVQLFETPWTTARQASLSITNSWSLLKLMSIESVMPSNHLILCRLLLLLPSIFQSIIRVFSNESVLRVR